MLPRLIVLVAISATFSLFTAEDAGYAGLLTPNFVVNSSADSEDFAIGNGFCDTSIFQEGEQCTLRAAIQEVNASVAISNEILFEIPGNGPHKIMPATEYPFITKPVLLDGYSQPGSAANTLGSGAGTNATIMIEIDTSNVPGFAFGVVLGTDDSTVRGLAINHGPGGGVGVEITGNGGHNRVEGNFLGTNVDGTAGKSGGWGVRITGSNFNVIGGTTPAARNLIVGDAAAVYMHFSGSVHNDVQGNLIGTDKTGTQSLDGGDGVEISEDAHSNLVGGTTPAARNVISGNDAGVLVAGQSSSGNDIQGNFIGTTASGLAALPNEIGVHLSNTFFNKVGAVTTLDDVCDGACNLVSGNATGLLVDGGSGTNAIAGNHIGTDLSGGHLGNTIAGVKIDGAAHHNGIQLNLIAHNGGPGVLATGTGLGNSIVGNNFHDNAGLAIDLVVAGADPDGVTPNDAMDADAGPNSLLNYPELTSAVAGSTVVSGTYHGLPDRIVTIAFYYSESCDPSGYGEAEVPIGARFPTTDANGEASFSFDVDTAPVGSFVTAHAFLQTGPDGNTSEFSNCVEVLAPATPTPTPIGQTPTPTPTPTPVGQTPAPSPTGQTPTPTPASTSDPVAVTWGDVDCSGIFDGKDAIAGVRHLAGAPSPPSAGCREIGAAVQVAEFGGLSWGDHDCSGTVAAADQQALLRKRGGLPVEAGPQCPTIGDVIIITG